MPQISTNAGPDRRGALDSDSRWTTLRPGRQGREPLAIARLALPKRRCVSKQAAFLDAFRNTASIRAAAEAAGIAPSRHFRWLEEDPRYWDAFMEAQRDKADALQGEAIERAVHGWLEPVFYRGRQCGALRHHDNRLLAVLLKAWKPEKYR